MTEHRMTWIDTVRRVPSPALLAAALALAACSEAPPAPSEVGAAASPLLCGAAPYGPPFLTDEPACTLEGGGALGGCVGRAVAVGDVNGDGRPDLVAGLTRCNGLGPATGRIAIFPGAETFFSAQPVIADIDWENTSPSTSANGLSIAVGEVNGDGLADLLVRSRYGVQVFAGQADLAAAIAAPVFRHPGNGLFYGAVLADVSGDGLDDLVSTKPGTISVFLSTPSSAAAPFTLTRTLQGMTVLGRGDFNQDAADDVLIQTDQGTALYPGCGAGGPGCDGGLGAAPLWTVPSVVRGFLPDQNGDGLREVVADTPTVGMGMESRLHVYLSDAQTGGPSTTPIWSVLGDPLFINFGVEVLFPGDMNKDGRSTEFVVESFGRLYAFFPPPQGVSADLTATWAWPRSDSLADLFGGQVTPWARLAGDLDGDRYDDLVVGTDPRVGDATSTGRIFFFRGGKVPPPPQNTPLPYLPEPATCNLGSGGLPDLTIDGDTLARSLTVNRKTFAADTCEMVEGCVDAPGLRRLLRFSVSIANLGAGPLIIPGPETEPDLYYFDSCHMHHHLTGFASYELRDPSGTLIATGRKQGFYLMDSTPYCIDSPPGEMYYPDQGITPGWGDVYGNDLPCQWLDITEVPDGTYKLRVSANDDGLIQEQDALPNFAEVDVEIAGDSVTVLP